MNELYKDSILFFIGLWALWHVIYILNHAAYAIWCGIDEVKYVPKESPLDRWLKGVDLYQQWKDAWNTCNGDDFFGMLLITVVAIPFSMLVWPVWVTGGLGYGAFLIARFLRRTQKGIRKLSTHAHDHPESVKKTEI